MCPQSFNSVNANPSWVTYEGPPQLTSSDPLQFHSESNVYIFSSPGFVCDHTLRAVHLGSDHKKHMLIQGMYRVI